jgi:hypothetical protein
MSPLFCPVAPTFVTEHKEVVGREKNWQQEGETICLDQIGKEMRAAGLQLHVCGSFYRANVFYSSFLKLYCYNSEEKQPFYNQIVRHFLNILSSSAVCGGGFSVNVFPSGLVRNCRRERGKEIP